MIPAVLISISTNDLSKTVNITYSNLLKPIEIRVVTTLERVDLKKIVLKKYY
jgi:hypothetical protein